MLVQGIMGVPIRDSLKHYFEKLPYIDIEAAIRIHASDLPQSQD